MFLNVMESFNSLNFLAGLVYFYIFLFFFSLFYLFFSKGLLIFFFIFNMLRSFFNVNSINYLFKGVVMSLFFFIFIFNFLGLILYSYCITSQLRFNSLIILSLWIPILLGFLFGDLHKFFFMFSPFGAPMFLIPLLNLIELVSFLIRPLTLFLRLSINMASGHVIISMIVIYLIEGGFLGFILCLLFLIILTIKIIVMVIQAYILFMLLNLYFDEF